MENKDLESRIQVIETELKTHEVQCEERWKTTFARLDDCSETLDRIESRIVLGGGAVIIFLLTLVMTILFR
jgi:hypothetical protein